MNNRDKNLKMNKGAPASWCVLPWSHVHIGSDGHYRLCCRSHNTKKMNMPGNVKQKALHINTGNWEDVMNNDMMKAVRRDMLEGKWPDECIRCKREHQSNIRPRSISSRFALAPAVEPENYPSYIKAKKLTQSDGSISLKEFPISYLDIRFGNLCNLKCIMCGPKDSNKWYEDYQALWGGEYFKDRWGESVQLKPMANGKLKTEKNVFNWSDDPHFWSQIEQHIRSFRRVFVAGGEPFLIEGHYNFLKKCIESGVAQKLTIDYNSNITHIPKKIWEFWKYFKSIDIGISLDGFGTVNDFIRYPSQWSQIEKNMTTLNNAGERFNLHIKATVSSLNIWHLPQFINYIMKKNYKRIGSIGTSSLIHSQPLNIPKYLNINILEQSFKEKIIKYFDAYKKKIADFDWQSAYGDSKSLSWEKKISKACSILDNYTNYMYTIQYNEADIIQWRKDFIYFMDKLDELRQTKWSETLPELYENTLNWRTF